MGKELDEVRRQLTEKRQELGRINEEIQRPAPSDGSILASVHESQRTLPLLARRGPLEREIERLVKDELRLLDQDAAIERGRAEGEARVAAEERGWWFRRFHTSLAIAHGGALAAITSKIVDPATDPLTVEAALVPITIFAIGLVLAGLIPYALYKENRRYAQVLANVSAGMFVGGLTVTIVSLGLLAAHTRSVDSRPTAARKPSAASSAARPNLPPVAPSRAREIATRALSR